jgi:threonine/homoserine/homoserine lactone efflux protein
LRLACGVYLVFLTWKLWGVGAGLRERTPVRFREVFVTTLLNPKGLVFALVIFPVPAGRAVSLTPYFAMFVIVCVMVAAAWIAAGAILHGRPAGRAVAPGVFRRLGAVVLGVFALFLLASGLMV